ncbi:MAG: DNA polymerase III subunit alpha [Erysipelotrichaceae bacterium]
MVHLHVRSAYTLLSSTLTIPKIIKACNEHHYQSVALCDFQVMHGAMAFYHACNKANIKPIFGMEVNVTQDNESYTYLLFAKNDDGYLQLMKLSTYLNAEHDQLSIEYLSSFCDDLFVVLFGEDTNFETNVINENQDNINAFLLTCSAAFSNFFVAISRNDSGLLKIKNKFLKQCCINLKIRTVAISRIYFLNREEEDSYKTLCAMKQGVSIHDKTLNYSPARYFRSKEEMDALYDLDDLAMSDYIADNCNVKMQFEKAALPQFENKYEVESSVYLKELCHKGLEKRMNFQKIPSSYVNRLSYELEVITNMHYEDYFLIVWDFIRFAKTQHIYVGPGRGSAAGSLVSYCLGITHIDPIKYNLLFERFLNPSRVSMPDIDTDFPDNRRDEVIAYVRERYGKQHVANIVTFNTLAAKQVMRDVGKTMGISLHDIDMLCRMIPSVVKATLQKTYESNPKFKQVINANPTFLKMFEIAKQLEGLPRHASQHAAGIVLSKDDIVKVCPLIDVDEGNNATQFTMEYLEELGLIKMDFLGLRNLTIIDEIVTNINKQHKLDIMKIPLDDRLTFDVIQKVDTVGIFQLESEGMKNLLRKMKPTNFEDIVATIALFRPGPMENIPEYLKRREHPETIDYLHPNLKSILENTYGIMIYQEQIMQVAQVMAGFSLAKADNLRKAISKKHEDELFNLQKEFIDGAIEKGYEKELAHKVYDLIMKFANYGFNRSHSVAYGMVAYQMAYLKANAPLYFFASLCNSVIGSENKTSEYIFEAKKRKIVVLSPSVNYSGSTYMIERNGLRFPLTAIKGIGSSLCNELLLEREQHGIYHDFFDFVARISTCRISTKIIESLIHAGALDDFKMNRASMLASLDDAMRYAGLVKIEDANQITIDFDLVSKPALKSIKENKAMRALREKEVIGFYLSDHPIVALRNKLGNDIASLIELQNKRGFVKLLCIVDRCKQHRTKNGDLMMFVSVSDETSSFDLVCMPNIYSANVNILIKGNYLLVEGKIDRENSCLVRKLSKVEIE